MKGVPEILVAVLNSLWQAAIVAAVVWIALKLLRRINAATRYVIWWAALAVVLVLPAAPAMMRWMHQRAPSASVATTNIKAPVPDAPALVNLPAIVTIQEQRSAQWPLWILALWAAVFLFRTIQVARSYFYLRGVKRRASVAPQAPPEVTRSAKLLLSRDVLSPMAVGFLHPAVILPASLPDELEKSELEHVLLHESAHLARNDDWTNLAVRLLGAALALHPVAMWILWRIEREREMACDDWVVAHIGSARPYAASLARMFELRWSRRRDLLASGIFGRGKLGDRIELLLKRGRTFSPRASLGRVAASAVVLLGFLIAGSFAPRWIAFAQQEPSPSFEVASIKPSDPGAKQFRLGIAPGGRFTASNASLKMLIQYAYDIRSHQMSGGPGWIDSDKYNIEAKADSAIQIPRGPAGQNQIRRMLQSLLADRFKLTLHRETKDLPIYRLTVAKNGPKFKEAECAGNPSPANPCTSFSVSPRGRLSGRSEGVSQLATALSTLTGQEVLDKTGLAGKYDFDLTWTPEPGQLRGPFGPLPASPEAPPPADPNSPSLFTAVQEQLGLKLESAKGPVEILVIDHAEKPSDN